MLFHLHTLISFGAWHVFLQLDVAEECLNQAKDQSGLLLLYSAVGDAEGLERLAASARENGKNNVAFVSLFLLGKVEECIDLLIERYFICQNVENAY